MGAYRDASSGDETVQLRGGSSGLAVPLPPEAALAALDPSRRLAHYVLIRELGRGSTGVVYKAWDTVLSRHVALKCFRAPEALASDRDRARREEEFLREARIAARLRHPNIVPIFEIGLRDGRPYLAMDFVGGGTLAERLRDGGEAGTTRFDRAPRELLAILRDVALAVDCAHRQAPPVVHRDLKPQNVLLDEDGRAFVVDFGLASEVRLDDGAGTPRRVFGSPSYMAPEQAEGRPEETDERTDVYGLGAILYEILTGRPPFVAANLLATIRLASEGDPEPPNRFRARMRRPRVPDALERICLRALRKRKEDRFPGAKEFADALSQALRPRRRRAGPLIAAIAAVGLAALGAGPLLRRPSPAAAPETDPAAAATLDEARAGWRDALVRLGDGDPREAAEDLRRRTRERPELAGEFRDGFRLALGALEPAWIREARALTADVPGPAWLGEDAKEFARTLEARLAFAGSLAADPELPYEAAKGNGELRAGLARVVEYRGTWTLRVNVSPYAEAALVRGGRELASGPTPLGLRGLEVSPEPCRLELCWPSRAEPRIRVVRELRGLKHGDVVAVDGPVADPEVAR